MAARREGQIEVGGRYRLEREELRLRATALWERRHDRSLALLRLQLADAGKHRRLVLFREGRAAHLSGEVGAVLPEAFLGVLQSVLVPGFVGDRATQVRLICET